MVPILLYKTGIVITMSEFIIYMFFHVLSRWASARARPQVDGSQNIFNTSITRSGGYTSMSFIRRINTRDSSQDISLSSPRFFVYGFNGPVDFSSNSISQHRNTPVVSNNRITLPTSAQCTGKTLIIKLLTEVIIFFQVTLVSVELGLMWYLCY